MYSLKLWRPLDLHNLGLSGELHLAQFLVALVAQFGVALGGDEEFFGLLGEGLHQGVVADLAHDEVAVPWLRTPYFKIKCSEQLAPVGLLRVEVEAVAHFHFFFSIGVRSFQHLPVFIWIIVPEVPVAALDGFLLLVAHFNVLIQRCSRPTALRATHTNLDAVVIRCI